MGAPSPELCNLWLARAFNAQHVDAAAPMYHPDASIVQVDDVHGGTSVARGSDAIRKTLRVTPVTTATAPSWNGKRRSTATKRTVNIG